MGKAVLIILLSSTLMFSIVSLNTNKILEQATSKSIGHHNQLRARNISNSMVQIALSELSDDVSYRVNSSQTKDLLGGTVSYTVKDTNFAGEDLIQIIAESEYFGFTKEVVAYTKVNVTELPPPFLQYALASGEHLKLMSGSRIEDDGNPLMNANVHVEGKLTLDVGSAIEGFATYGESIDGEVGNIVPNYNPDGDPPYSQATVDMPYFDPADFTDLYDEIYPGHTILGGPITLGTKDNPKFIYFEGNLTFDSTVTVTGYGGFLVGEATTLAKGNSIVPADPDNSSFALYSVGKIAISGGGDFYGQIYGLDGSKFQGGVNIYGSVTVKGKSELDNGGHIYYRPAGANLTSPFWEGEVGSGGGRMTALYYNE